MDVYEVFICAHICIYAHKSSSVFISYIQASTDCAAKMLKCCSRIIRKLPQNCSKIEKVAFMM